MPRDTAEDWKRLGQEEPWWGVLSAPEFLKANLTAEAKERFYAQGRQEMAWVVETLQQHFGPVAPQIGADFGSGLGRLTFPMAALCETAHGIDISEGMRSEAGRQAQARGLGNVSFSEELAPGVMVDWINSYIVFQHILPRIGYGIVAGLLDRLRPAGLVSLQFTFAHDLRDRNTLIRDLRAWRFDGETLTTLESNDYAVGEMSMYDYDLNRLLMIFARAGIRDVFLRHTDHGGVHGFWIFGRKTH
ncbi:class I SAM-dependent methyltransferase [uncultured Enterovirga sp.]|uniref:class I SAM-dependent methyltransferase n=1 Tax=uncultured Enterovirga sp. TaxID=2026352 RepID=UPI0035CB8F09